MRHVDLTDSTDILNEGFNQMLEEIAAEWTRGDNPRKFAKRVYKVMGGRHYIDKYERWARNHPEIELIAIPREQSIYRGGPFWQTRVVFFFGLGPVIRINEELVGIDKMGHFLSTGWKYHRRHMRGESEDKVLELGTRPSPGSSAFSPPASSRTPT